MINLLVINPNTSTYITEDLRVIIDRLDYPDVTFSYYTSETGPTILASTADLHASTLHTLGPVRDLADRYDGFLIACYADHPLTRLLQMYVSPKAVVGIFEASVMRALDVLDSLPEPGESFGIITTGQFYEVQLTHGVQNLMKRQGRTADQRIEAVFAGVVSTGISPERIKTESTEKIRRRIETATKRLLKERDDVKVICMGGVILIGMEQWVRAACVAEMGASRGGEVVIVDQMIAGVGSLIDCVKTRLTMSRCC